MKLRLGFISPEDSRGVELLLVMSTVFGWGHRGLVRGLACKRVPGGGSMISSVLVGNLVVLRDPNRYECILRIEH